MLLVHEALGYDIGDDRLKLAKRRNDYWYSLEKPFTSLYKLHLTLYYKKERKTRNFVISFTYLYHNNMIVISRRISEGARD